MKEWIKHKYLLIDPRGRESKLTMADKVNGEHKTEGNVI